MYSEEVDLCRRLKGAGWRVIYVPEARVVHYEGRSSDQAVAARHIHFNRSKIRYATLYFGPRWAEVLRRYLLWEFRRQWLDRGRKMAARPQTSPARTTHGRLPRSLGDRPALIQPRSLNNHIRTIHKSGEKAFGSALRFMVCYSRVRDEVHKETSIANER